MAGCGAGWVGRSARWRDGGRGWVEQEPRGGSRMRRAVGGRRWGGAGELERYWNGRGEVRVGSTVKWKGESGNEKFRKGVRPDGHQDGVGEACGWVENSDRGMGIKAIGTILVLRANLPCWGGKILIRALVSPCCMAPLMQWYIPRDVL